MISVIGIAICFLSLVFGKFLDYRLMIALAFLGIGITFSIFLFPQRPKFKERKLIYEYELLPIVSNAYLIKTCNGKFICRYVNENNEEKIDTIMSYWKEIKEVDKAQKASIKWYERNPKLSLTVLPFAESRIEVELTIPKGTIVK